MAEKEKRTAEQLREHYEIEKELAFKLKGAVPSERKNSYSKLYNELLTRVAHHPQLVLLDDSTALRQKVNRQLQSLRRFLMPDKTFLEIGAGDCSVALAVARKVKRVYAIEVSRKMVEELEVPQNFELMITDGISIPLPENSISVAYSYQFIEHLHIDDALEHLQNIHKVLVPGGVYLCITPNRLAGPHDVSKYFDEVATGFHLKEYTNTELIDLFRRAGFSKSESSVGGRTIVRRIPIRPYEFVLSKLPSSFRRKLTRGLPFGVLWDLAIAGTK